MSKFCSKCKSENIETSNFCTRCGSIIENNITDYKNNKHINTNTYSNKIDTFAGSASMLFSILGCLIAILILEFFPDNISIVIGLITSATILEIIAFIFSLKSKSPISNRFSKKAILGRVLSKAYFLFLGSILLIVLTLYSFGYILTGGRLM